jgi:hypothetical protein
MYCKTSFLNPIFIANCWMGLGLFGYFSQTAAVNPLVILFAINVWLMFFYDVAYLGYFKDPQDDKNLLRSLGSTFDTVGWYMSKKALALGFGFKFANIGISIAMLYLSLGSYIKTNDAALVILGLVFACMALLYVTYKTATLSPFSKRKALTLCALSEMATYSVMMFALGAVIGGSGLVVVLILLPIMWFICVNRYIWGKGWGLAPNV